MLYVHICPMTKHVYFDSLSFSSSLILVCTVYSDFLPVPILGIFTAKPIINNPDYFCTGLIGASPDAIVLDKMTAKMIGLCEFKAPVHRMYPSIPRQYMVQMQGQMAVTGEVRNRNLFLHFIFVYAEQASFKFSKKLAYDRIFTCLYKFSNINSDI